MTTTKRGNELAHSLNPYIGTTEAIRETCSKIARLAKTHARYQELACNRELTRRELADESRIEALIRDHVADLPNTDHGAITVKFQGDPRGFTVKLVIPGVPHAGNTWGLGGEFGV